MSRRVLIIGGGVIGLACAYACSRRGHRVTVLDKGGVGGQASGAAAGMLAPFSENAEGADAFFRLCLDSLRLYPHWVEEIKAVSGLDFEYTTSGSLYAAYHEADLLAMEERLGWQREFGTEGCIVEGERLYRMEPLLSRQVVAAIHIPEESHIYAPLYVKALEQACRNAGVHILEHLAQVDIVRWHDEVRVLCQDGRVFSADSLVVCSGAWAQELESTFEMTVPVYPIRGQICAYTAPAETLRHMIFSSQGYVVAKANGTVVCGASEDVAGFETSVTDAGINRLQKLAGRLVPSLAYRKPMHKWAGLRPATQDGYPLIGTLQQAGHVIFAVGHYRNGILLSPATGQIVADLIDDKPVHVSVGAFRPERFC